MKFKQLVMCISILSSGHAWANVTEYCPNPSDIKEEAPGVYIASIVSGDGEWYGVSQKGRGPVGEFDVAVFKSHTDVEGSTVIGEILRCGYLLQKGDAVDMRFQGKEKEKETLVSIDIKDPWTQWYSQYYCESKEPRACKFNELIRPAKR
ncbi:MULTISPECIES: DUF3757 domain-containing protein [unclassified Pseudomonas]|jgi:hypothetical protein|uniref:DUF3757 domain-containing protein n=1 Tax=Pseudomonas sp. A-R-26 TaxID=2832404 RepID=UPI001CBB53D2|nr:DUF3757 domain-containing protein [Pseudomonas sp. A-R-26]